MNENDLPEMIEKARTYKFKPLRRGSAQIVTDTLNKWFHTSNKTQTIMDIKNFSGYTQKSSYAFG